LDEKTPEKIEFEKENGSNFLNLKKVAETDPNLALVGLRIELEKKLRSLGQSYEGSPKANLNGLVRFLANKGVLSGEMPGG